MEETCPQDIKNNINNINGEEKKEKNDIIEDKRKESEDVDMIIEGDISPHSKRSYSCKINEQFTKKKFSGCEEIKLNINKKYAPLKTPQIKPMKCDLNPEPINIGMIKKNSRFKPINGNSDIDKKIFNEIISEGDNEISDKDSPDSDSDFNEEDNLKYDNPINNINDQENLDLFKKFGFFKLPSENKIFTLPENKIKEENDDDYNENGNLMLKNLRRKMFETKKNFLKKNKDSFDIMNHELNEKFKKYKEDILMPKSEIKLHNTISFSNSKAKNKEISIFEFLRKNSSIDMKKLI
jgi:hypothetical protein